MVPVTGLSGSIILMRSRVVVVLIVVVIVVVIAVLSTFDTIVRPMTYVFIISVRTAIGSVRTMSFFSLISRRVRTRPMSSTCPTRRTMVIVVTLSRHDLRRSEVSV